jgi:uncharacterized protein (TIGR02145 family)
MVKMADGKVWMAENLNYQTGLTFIQDVTQPGNGDRVIGSFWCPAVSGSTISADKNTCNTYGALYTWETAMSENGKGTWDESKVSGRYHESDKTPNDAIDDPTNHTGICPGGWHLPTDYEWATLLDAVDPHCGSYTAQVGSGYYGSEGVAGAGDGVGASVQMKSASTYLGSDPGNGAWADHDYRGNDATGFGMVPAGQLSVSPTALFYLRGTGTSFWSSSASTPARAWYRYYTSTNTRAGRNHISRMTGYSVRCVRN